MSSGSSSSSVTITRSYRSGGTGLGEGLLPRTYILGNSSPRQQVSGLFPPPMQGNNLVESFKRGQEGKLLHAARPVGLLATRWGGRSPLVSLSVSLRLFASRKSHPRASHLFFLSSFLAGSAKLQHHVNLPPPIRPSPPTCSLSATCNAFVLSVHRKKEEKKKPRKKWNNQKHFLKSCFLQQEFLHIIIDIYIDIDINATDASGVFVRNKNNLFFFLQQKESFNHFFKRTKPKKKELFVAKRSGGTY